jgi:hypothetical protein
MPEAGRRRVAARNHLASVRHTDPPPACTRAAQCGPILACSGSGGAHPVLALEQGFSSVVSAALGAFRSVAGVCGETLTIASA